MRVKSWGANIYERMALYALEQDWTIAIYALQQSRTGLARREANFEQSKFRLHQTLLLQEDTSHDYINQPFSCAMSAP